jgi:hypothetical protein
MIDNEANPPGIVPRMVRETSKRGNRDLRVGTEYRRVSQDDGRHLHRVRQNFGRR